MCLQQAEIPEACSRTKYNGRKRKRPAGAGSEGAAGNDFLRQAGGFTSGGGGSFQVYHFPSGRRAMKRCILSPAFFGIGSEMTNSSSNELRPKRLASSSL